MVCFLTHFLDLFFSFVSISQVVPIALSFRYVYILKVKTMTPLKRYSILVFKVSLCFQKSYKVSSITASPMNKLTSNRSKSRFSRCFH